jgi:hypothetical protein
MDGTQGIPKRYVLVLTLSLNQRQILGLIIPDPAVQKLSLNDLVTRASSPAPSSACTDRPLALRSSRPN